MLKIGVSTSVKISNIASSSYQSGISGSSFTNNTGVGYNGLYGQDGANINGVISSSGTANTGAASGAGYHYGRETSGSFSAAIMNGTGSVSSGSSLSAPSILSPSNSIDNPLGSMIQHNTITLSNTMLSISHTMSSVNGLGSGDSIGSGLSSTTSHSGSGASGVSTGGASSTSASVSTTPGLTLQYQPGTHHPNNLPNSSQALSSTLDSNISQSIISAMNQTIFSSVAFHPKQHIIYSSIRNEVYAYDLLSQSIIGKATIDQGENIRHLHILYNSSNNSTLLLCINEVGVIYLFDTESYKLLTIVHQLKALDARPLTCKTVAKLRPMMFFSKLNSKDIVVIDFLNKSQIQYKLKGHKKPISSLAHHPTKPLLASVSNDGSLKFWDTRNGLLYLNFEDFASYENTRNIEHSNNFFLSFESQGKYLVLVGSSGLTLVYGDILSQNPQEIIANGFICKGSTILSISHHPHLPVFFVLSRNQNGIEELSTWDINYTHKSIVPSTLIPTFVPESNDSLSYLSKYFKPLTVPKLSPYEIIVHPTKNYITFQWEVSNILSESISPLAGQYLTSQSFASIRHIYQNIYSVNSFDHLNYSFPLLSPVPLPMGFFIQPEPTFNYPHECVFFDGSFVKAYQPLNGVTKKLLEQPILNSSNPDEIAKPKKFLYNDEFQLFVLIYFSNSISTQTHLSKYMIMDSHGGLNQEGEGFDAVMIGNSQILVLGLEGKLAKVATISKQAISSFKNFTLTPKVSSVYSTPLQDGKVVMYFTQENQKPCILFSKNISPDQPRDNYGIETNPSFGQLLLYPREKVYRVEWQSDPKSSQHICAIMTDQRIIITNPRLMIINQIRVPPQHKSNQAYFTSIYWIEWSLLYTTPTQLMYLTLQSNLPPRPISSLTCQPLVLSMVLPDRFIFGYQGNQVPGRNETSLRCQTVGLLECLIIGLLSLPPFISYEKKFISSCLQNLVAKFDHSRVSKFTLDKLREKSFTDLAYSLANQMKPTQSKQSSFDKFKLSWASKQYEDANKHLTEEFTRLSALLKSNSEQQQASKTQFSKLKDNMRDFARECMKAGHYTLAKDCFTKLSENVYLLQIAILLNDKEAIQNIRKEAENRSDQILVSACDKALSGKPRNNIKLNPPVVKILPWEPTPTTNLSIKVGLDYLSPMNLHSIQRYFPVVGEFSGASVSMNGSRHKLRAPDENWPPQDYKHSVTLAPPRTCMSLFAHKLNTKSHISSTQTLRRSPSAENLIKFNRDDLPKSINTTTVMDYDDDSDDSESGADADVDSETEEDLAMVSKSLENTLKEQLAIDPEETHDSSEINSTELESEDLNNESHSIDANTSQTNIDSQNLNNTTPQ